MAQELQKWLEDIDIEEYLEKFKELGVKKCKHLCDVTHQHLLDMGMLELERKRFFEKLELAKKDHVELNTSTVTPKTMIGIKMPTLAFGQKQRQIPKSELINEYKDLYYEEPEINWKQRESNKFTLTMCSSASWRFQSKRALMDWARSEYDDRVNSLLIFCPREDIVGETQYFKKQNIEFGLQKLESEYEDVRKMINNEKLINKHKRDRMYAFKAEMEALNKTVHETKNFIDNKVSYVSSKNGHEEELEYWTKVRRRSNVVIDMLATKISRLDTLLNKATDMFGPGPQTAATRKKRERKEEQ